MSASYSHASKILFLTFLQKNISFLNKDKT